MKKTRISADDLGAMHWKERWESEADREADNLHRLPEKQILNHIRSGKLGKYFRSGM